MPSDIVLRIRPMRGQEAALKRALSRWVDDHMKQLSSYCFEEGFSYSTEPTNDVAGNLLFAASTTKTGV